MPTIDELLTRVSKPARYTGGEWNSVTKDWDSALSAYRAGLSRRLRHRYVEHGTRDPVRPPEQGRRRLMRARVRAVGRHGDARCAKGDVPLWSLETRTPHQQVRCPRVHAAIRDDLHEHPEHARPRRNTGLVCRAWRRAPHCHRRRERGVQSRTAGTIRRCLLPRRG